MVALDHVQLAMPPGEEMAAEAFYAGILGFRKYVDDPFGNRLEIIDDDVRGTFPAWYVFGEPSPALQVVVGSTQASQVGKEALG